MSNNNHGDSDDRDFDTAIQACALLVDNLRCGVRREIAKGIVSKEDVVDLFECLGGTVARYLLDAVQQYDKPEIPDSFLEGFCGFLRYQKTKRREDGTRVADRLLSAVDKTVFRN